MSLRISTGSVRSASVSVVLGLEGERWLSPSGRPLRSRRAHGAGFGAAGRRAQHLDGERACGVVGGSAHARAATPPSITVSCRVPECAAQALRRSRCRRRESTPSDSQTISACRGGVEKARRARAARRCVRPHRACGLICLSAHARCARRLERDIAAGFRQRHERDAAAVGLGPRHQVVGGAQARVPGAGGRPAVVDHAAPAAPWRSRGRDRRIPQRAGGRDDDQRGERQAQQREPPRRARAASPPWARCRTVAGSAGNRSGAAAAGPAATATTAPAGSAGPAAPAAPRNASGRSGPSCVPPGHAVRASGATVGAAGRRPCGHAGRAGARSPHGRCGGW